MHLGPPHFDTIESYVPLFYCILTEAPQSSDDVYQYEKFYMSHLRDVVKKPLPDSSTLTQLHMYVNNIAFFD